MSAYTDTSWIDLLGPSPKPAGAPVSHPVAAGRDETEKLARGWRDMLSPALCRLNFPAWLVFVCAVGVALALAAGDGFPWQRMCVLVTMFAGAVFIPSVETGQRSVMKIALPKAAAWGGAKLTLGAQVRRISCYGFHNKAYAGYRRDRELTLDVRISPTAPVILDKLGVMLWGQRFDADSLPVRLINGVTGYSLVLRIPGKLVVDTDDAKVYACANGAEWISEPFNVDFGVRRTVLT